MYRINCKNTAIQYSKVNSTQRLRVHSTRSTLLLSYSLGAVHNRMSGRCRDSWCVRHIPSVPENASTSW